VARIINFINEGKGRDECLSVYAGDVLYNTFRDIVEKEFDVYIGDVWNWNYFEKNGKYDFSRLCYYFDKTEQNIKNIKKALRNEFSNRVCKRVYKQNFAEEHRNAAENAIVITQNIEEILDFVIKREPDIIGKIESGLPDYLKQKYPHLTGEYGFFDTVNEDNDTPVIGVDTPELDEDVLNFINKKYPKLELDKILHLTAALGNANFIEIGFNYNEEDLHILDDYGFININAKFDYRLPNDMCYVFKIWTNGRKGIVDLFIDIERFFDEFLNEYPQDYKYVEKILSSDIKQKYPHLTGEYGFFDTVNEVAISKLFKVTVIDLLEDVIRKTRGIYLQDRDEFCEITNSLEVKIMLTSTITDWSLKNFEKFCKKYLLECTIYRFGYYHIKPKNFNKTADILLGEDPSRYNKLQDIPKAIFNKWSHLGQEDYGFFDTTNEIYGKDGSYELNYDAGSIILKEFIDIISNEFGIKSNNNYWSAMDNGELPDEEYTMVYDIQYSEYNIIKLIEIFGKSYIGEEVNRYYLNSSTYQYTTTLIMKLDEVIDFIVERRPGFFGEVRDYMPDFIKNDPKYSHLDSGYGFFDTSVNEDAETPVKNLSNEKFNKDVCDFLNKKYPKLELDHVSMITVALGVANVIEIDVISYNDLETNLRDFKKITSDEFNFRIERDMEYIKSSNRQCNLFFNVKKFFNEFLNYYPEDYKYIKDDFNLKNWGHLGEYDFFDEVKESSHIKLYEDFQSPK
jgi:hypothetical protein